MDKKVMYTEDSETENCSVLKSSIIMSLTCGFPFILTILFTALGAFLTEKSMSEFIQQIVWPAGILASIVTVSLLLSMLMASICESESSKNRKKFV